MIWKPKNQMKMSSYKFYLIVLVFSMSFSNIRCTDITDLAFNGSTGYITVAYADFDSDELTDLFVLHEDFHSFEILKGAYVEPLFLSTNYSCTYPNFIITSLVPGDFDGDAFMDVLMTVKEHDGMIGIYICWGGYHELNCQNNTEPIIKMHGEPSVLDYNHDFIMDLFGLIDNKRSVVVFEKERGKNYVIKMSDHHHNEELGVLKEVAHAVLDLNGDYLADLCLSTDKGWEFWHGVEGPQFNFSHQITIPDGSGKLILGQSLFLDFQLEGKLSQLVPTCFDRECKNSSILIPQRPNHIIDLEINFKDTLNNHQWGFLVPSDEEFYRKTIILRGGDFNRDGFIDLIVTLKNTKNGNIQTFYLENVKKNNHGSLKRSFEVKWDLDFGKDTIMGSFYDFYQDGIPDVILLQKNTKNSHKFKPLAFRNTLDYDANFLKVIVLTGLENAKAPTESNRKIYGTNLPGPRIEYNTSTQEGNPVHGIAVQLPQSAYLSLHLPYTSFGLGRTPNFVEFVTVGLAGKKAILTQLIPNSQIFVVPKPINEPDKWKSQLFITPSKIILKSVFALGGICICIIIIIFVLHIKERRQDKIEKLQEAHRFHFDAM